MKRVFLIAVVCFAWLVCIIAGFMEVRAYQYQDAVIQVYALHQSSTGLSGAGRTFISEEGFIQISNVSWERVQSAWVTLNGRAVSKSGWSFTSERIDWPFQITGFWSDSYVDAQPTYTLHEQTFRIPWWSIFFPFLILAAPPTVIWIRRRHRIRRRIRLGQCIGCGYDLRASPARCPECGRAVASNVPTAS